MTVKKLPRSSYFKHLFSPLLLIFLCLIISYCFPFGSRIKPVILPDGANLEAYYDSGASYLSVKADHLYYSGCTYEQNGKRKGYYFYTLQDDVCQFYILPPNQIPSGQPSDYILVPLEQAELTGTITSLNDAEYSQLLQTLASQINWTQSNLSALASPYVFFASGATYVKGLVLYSILFVCMAVACSDILLTLLRLVLSQKSKEKQL